MLPQSLEKKPEILQPDIPLLFQRPALVKYKLDHSEDDSLFSSLLPPVIPVTDIRGLCAMGLKA